MHIAFTIIVTVIIRGPVKKGFLAIVIVHYLQIVQAQRCTLGAVFALTSNKCRMLLLLVAGCPTWRYTATPPSTKPVGLPEPIQPEQDSVLMVMFTIPFTPGPGHVTRDT